MRLQSRYYISAQRKFGQFRVGPSEISRTYFGREFPSQKRHTTEKEFTPPLPIYDSFLFPFSFNSTNYLEQLQFHNKKF